MALITANPGSIPVNESISVDRDCYVILKWGWRHSSVDSSAPTILPPRVRVQAYHLLSFIAKFLLHLSCENKQKEDWFGPFLKKISLHWPSPSPLSHPINLCLVQSISEYRYLWINQSIPIYNNLFLHLTLPNSLPQNTEPVSMLLNIFVVEMSSKNALAFFRHRFNS